MIIDSSLNERYENHGRDDKLENGEPRQPRGCLHYKHMGYK
jgi:hypothetical protein